MSFPNAPATDAPRNHFGTRYAPTTTTKETNDIRNV
jgi:hypothetical protein